MKISRGNEHPEEGSTRIPKAPIVYNHWRGSADIYDNIRLATKQGFAEGSQTQCNNDDIYYRQQYEPLVNQASDKGKREGEKAMYDWFFQPCTEHMIPANWLPHYLCTQCVESKLKELGVTDDKAD